MQNCFKKIDPSFSFDMKDFDLNGNGEFDYTEFMTATMAATVVTDEKRLADAFN